ncbi:MAG: hypothetical protein JW719_05250 [Pirellulales bacterium]|nr:hypothetical protein [Pirellulales bacterium]
MVPRGGREFMGRADRAAGIALRRSLVGAAGRRPTFAGQRPQHYST